jgi:hypothetical protein
MEEKPTSRGWPGKPNPGQILENAAMGLICAGISCYPSFFVFFSYAGNYAMSHPISGEGEDFMVIYLYVLPILFIGVLMGIGLGQLSYRILSKGNRLLSNTFAAIGGVITSILIIGLITASILASWMQ